MLNEEKDTSPMSEINSFKFEENIFNKVPQEIPKKKGKGKKPKAIDFMEYAESNGIKINIQYEDKTNQPTFYNKDKKDFSKQFEQKRFRQPYNKDDKRKVEDTKKDDNETIDYNAFNFNENYSNQRNYDNTSDNYYNNNFYSNSSNTNSNDYSNNYTNYTKRKNNQIAVDLPEQSDIFNSQQNVNKQTMFTKENKFDKSQYAFPREQNMMNYQTMMPNNVFNPMTMPMNPFIPLHQIYPVRDEEILDVIEYLFSAKNLNRDIYLRESMDINGWVNAEVLILHPNRKLKIMNVTIDRINNIIDKIGSDYVEKRIRLSTLELRAKNYYDFKSQLMSVNDIKQKILSQFPMTQPMGFTPPQVYPQMMNIYMQRPPIDPMLFQQMQMRKMNMMPPNAHMPMMPIQYPQNDNN